MNAESVADRAARVWDESIVPAVVEYIRIPNVSPGFDVEWAAHGHMEEAVQLIAAWCEARPLPGLTVSVERLPGRTPLLVIGIPAAGGAADRTVLLYGHLDKQPPMPGWRDGLGPWNPVIEGDRLYGRGGADDGYSAFAALTAIEACVAGGGQHCRCIVLIEASEESASEDLPAYVEALADRIGTPELVVCLDSGCATYDRLWLTTSLRGLIAIDVDVRILDEGVHSGAAGGVVPSTFSILRQLLNRIEDPDTGHLLVPELHVTIPSDRKQDLVTAATTLGREVASEFPFVNGARSLNDGDPIAQLRAKTWEPSLEVIGIDGVPSVADAGNVLRAFTRARLSIRIPPTCDPDAAATAVVARLCSDPPHGAAINVETSASAAGWSAPTTEAWLGEAIDAGSHAGFGAGAHAIGEGGTIPFMAMLGHRFPSAQFVVTGVLGPESNAHGPNEFLHLPTARAVTIATAHILDAHARTHIPAST